jgi:hypothetical protein
MPKPPIAMRPFGRAEDLSIAFADADRPGLVTQLLDRCSDGGAAFWWRQPVGARIESLLHLCALTEGTSAIVAHLRCENCGEAFEIELPIDALEGHDAEPMRIELDNGRAVRMRRPTGEDLRRWHVARYASRSEASAAMIEALCIDGRIAPEDEAALAEAVAARDPLVAFSASCTCPACGAEDDLPVDLESLALQRLAARQLGLLREVHLLASHYGWTEAEALAVPPERRARYLALIEDMP